MGASINTSFPDRPSAAVSPVFVDLRSPATGVTCDECGSCGSRNDKLPVGKCKHEHISPAMLQFFFAKTSNKRWFEVESARAHVSTLVTRDLPSQPVDEDAAQSVSGLEDRIFASKRRQEKAVDQAADIVKVSDERADVTPWAKRSSMCALRPVELRLIPDSVQSSSTYWKVIRYQLWVTWQRIPTVAADTSTHRFSYNASFSTGIASTTSLTVLFFTTTGKPNTRSLEHPYLD